MAMKNRYAVRLRISKAKLRQLVRLFAVDPDAKQIAEPASLNRNAVNRQARAIRARIAAFCEEGFPFAGEVEISGFSGAQGIASQL